MTAEHLPPTSKHSIGFPSQDGYSDLIDASIDTLNVEHAFTGSTLRKNERKARRRFPLFKTPLFILLVATTALNIAVGLYLLTSQESALTTIEANKALEDHFRAQGNVLSPITTLTSFTYLYTNPEDPDFTSAVQNFRSSLADLGTDIKSLFLIKDFRFAQGGIYWVPPKSQESKEAK